MEPKLCFISARQAKVGGESHVGAQDVVLRRWARMLSQSEELLRQLLRLALSTAPLVVCCNA